MTDETTAVAEARSAYDDALLSYHYALDTVPQYATPPDQAFRALVAAVRAEERESPRAVAAAWEQAIAETFIPDVAAELYEAASVRALAYLRRESPTQDALT